MHNSQSIVDNSDHRRLLNFLAHHVFLFGADGQAEFFTGTREDGPRLRNCFSEFDDNAAPSAKIIFSDESLAHSGLCLQLGEVE